MTKRSKSGATSDLAVRDARTGQIMMVKGVGSLRGSGFTLRRGVDPTKPIASQTSKKKPSAEPSAIG